MRFVRLARGAMLGALLLSGVANAQRFVCMESNEGNWCLELQWAAAPNTVTNFLRYVNSGGYGNDLIHRSVTGFVIQGGGFNIDASNTINPVTTLGAIKNEYSLSNLRGTVAMAKLGGDPDSATSQWFINLGDNSANLDNQNGGFTVFAKVAQGMDVIDKIAALRIANLSTSLGSNFAEMPIDAPSGATSVSRSNLVIISRAYATDLMPGTTAAQYHCSTPSANDALTEVCSGTVTFPVNVAGMGYYEVTLQLVSGGAQVVLAIKPGTLKRLGTAPAAAGTYDPTTKLLTLPSVRNGASIYTALTLKMTNDAAQQFTLQSFTRQ